MSKYTEITKANAKARYVLGKNVYVTTNDREYWRMPRASEYGSHAPAEELFHRSIPEYEGDVKFFVLNSERRWICHYTSSKGNDMQKVFSDMDEGLAFTRTLDRRIERGTCGGYTFSEI
jgi:hypothetical protein